MNRALAVALLLAALIVPASPGHASQPARLVDQGGRGFTFASLRGKPLVVTFVAAHCTDACPLVNAQFQQAGELFAARHIDARLLTITLDPENDPPAVMRDLARRFSADPRHWIVASGRVNDVHAIMREFGVQTQRGPDGYADVHTTFVYILDRHGRLFKTMLASTMLGTQIADEVRSQWRMLAQ
jgi:protein SCO1/2